MMTDTNRVTTPFGAEFTAREVLEGVDLVGRRTIVTGAPSGIGVETARALAGVGAEVVGKAGRIEVLVNNVGQGS